MKNGSCAKRRHRRLMVPFNPHRTEETVEIDASPRLPRNNHGLFTRQVSRTTGRIALHALDSAPVPPPRKTSTAVSRFKDAVGEPLGAQVPPDVVDRVRGRGKVGRAA
jgi:hypothetical protein